MVDRFLVWLGAGVVAAGMSAGMLAGIGVASADSPSGSDGGAAASSQSAKSVEKKADSDKFSNDYVKGSADPKPTKKPKPKDPKPTDATSPTTPAASTAGTAHRVRLDAQKPVDPPANPQTTTGADVKPVVTAKLAQNSSVGPGVNQPALAVAASAETKTAATTPSAAVAVAAPAVATAAVAAPAPATPIPPSFINVIGTIFFSIFELVQNIVSGPPTVPPGSTVRVSQAPLTIDCGPGQTVAADWYFPTTGPPPTRLIYFQHGFPAVASNYDYTSATLAQQNDAIVVAPTISSNIFDCFGCQLTGDSMHAAVAELFEGDRSALTESARLASGDANLVPPERFVIAGHSAGGLLAAGAAGYYSADALANGTPNDLAGVLLLDTSPVGGTLERGLAKIPDDIPVYTISSDPGPLNSYGGANDILEAARPGQFVGVQLVGGAHSDAAQTGIPLVQLFSQLAGLGFSQPQNVQAVQVLAQGWINDWYDGTHTGIYGDLGSTIDIPTTAGTAQAYVLPAPAPQLTFIDLIVNAVLDALGGINFAYCAAPIDGTEPVQTEFLTEKSTPNTAISLDENAQTGQSVGQHVCTG